ncbi:MAG: CPBP family intramembrane metalloprotease [Salinibacterium sp.]|nr:CPBP family intramembrane glutamic endopeptidase [Salinibacterium sp.]MBF0671608.1 CPBP family intramembrane metalloprotease [Salinibacterium sp.]
MSTPANARANEQRSPRQLAAEVVIVLGLSLGASALYSIVAIINRLTREETLSQQTATLNTSLSSRPVFDFVYQVMGVFFDLMPVALVCYLLWNVARPHLSALGLDLRRPARDTLHGLALALVIGIPGLALYLVGKELGITVTVVPTALDEHWWTVPVLLLSAARAGIVEEVIAVGYLRDRLKRIGWGPWAFIAASSLLRACYHLYQGFGAFVGNLAMGALFAWLYHRAGRLLPLVIAHFLIDAAVFIGYPWAAAAFPELLAP